MLRPTLRKEQSSTTPLRVRAQQTTVAERSRSQNTKQTQGETPGDSMSQNNFAGGFIAGAFLGGLIGGVVGVLASNRLRSEDNEEDFMGLSGEDRRQLENATTEERMEIARRGLEDKISQLNMAIEDVRVQMGNVNNGHPPADYPSTSFGSSTSSEQQS
ncbi:MAG: hypothetical protein AAFO84_12830 [Cyanobacteria bacterium J06598_1]